MKEVHILEVKGGCIWVSCVGIFPWAEEEKDTEKEHVSNCLCLGSVCTMSQGNSVGE